MAPPEAGAPDGACLGTGWSAVASAPANSQLAGVLAGFVFAGFVMILTERRMSPLRTATLRLFIAGFIVLALDSYAFSLLTGDVAEQACGRVWTESLIASGMLVVGAVAVISGMSWLLASYVEVQSDEEPDGGTATADGHQEAMRTLERLLRRSVYGITTLTVLLLSTAAHDYVNVVFGGRQPPGWASWVSPLYVLLVGTAMIVTVWRRQRRRTRRAGEPAAPPRNELPIAFTCAVSYAVLGTAAIGVTTSTPVSAWNPVPEAVAACTVGVVLIMPVPTVLALIYAMPRSAPRLPGPRTSPDSGTFTDPESAGPDGA
ncbi:hypothetical protein ABZ840_21245 [Streptomyces sp. NPDC047117]|uniref:hypothetical protein n=1 Tax=unclassified Streptomyces TaxID=2593676 RepID=UPI0033FE8319